MIHPQGPFGLNPRMMNQLNMRMAAAAAAHAAQPPLGGPRGLRFPGSYFMWFDEKNNFEKKIHSKPQSIIEQNESSTPHIHTYTIKKFYHGKLSDIILYWNNYYYYLLSTIYPPTSKLYQHILKLASKYMKGGKKYIPLSPKKSMLFNILMM